MNLNLKHVIIRSRDRRQIAEVDILAFSQSALKIMMLQAGIGFIPRSLCRSASADLTSRVLARWTKSDRGETARLTYTNLAPSKWRRSRRLQMHISAATFLKILVSTCEYGWDTESDRLIAAIYYWKDYKAGCGSPSTCSTPSGGKSWGCCDKTSCYIPATCEDASAPDCGGTAASLCPYSPIMKW